MEELYTKKVKCPVCKNDFTTSKVKSSKLRIEKRDTDFFTYYRGENPLKYSVFVCPECGYAALEDKFDKIKSKDIEVIKQNVSDKWRKREFSLKRSVDDAIVCYKLALYCGQLLNFKNYDLGNITLRLAWMNRLNENSKEEERFLKLSAELFENAYYNEDIPSTPFDELSLAYLIGELHRRLGDREEALKWFSKVISNRAVKNNPRLDKLVRDQWYLVKGER
ncbi:hypothetical protein SAMN02745135_01347 [Caloranaerobacter azorensis DSM 13643]|uniref:DUF2225 domain-containing protein n=1 Tax=Caloranaerobacter azorensis DSM 13643 TaxID=1121264 RepID=A0A1M5UBE7_9FIRM|nr:DUF2225 domain-containing protein [Caloranaerobacter azorensis]SHH60289.1 hypothetical protein SAMN02745135_01347 [Caloranaerobacter azorensis DSM 13643]